MRSEHRRRELPTRSSIVAAGSEQQRDELRRRVQPGVADMQSPSRQMAAERTGSITVTVDARGRVIDVDVKQQWRSRLGRDELAGAVFAAYMAARERAVEAFALAVLAAEETGADPPQIPVANPDPPDDPPQNAPTDPVEWLVWMHERFARIREEANRVAVGRGVVREHAGPHGYLSATLEGSGVVGIAADTSRIWYAATAAIREDALAVLSATDRKAA